MGTVAEDAAGRYGNCPHVPRTPATLKNYTPLYMACIHEDPLYRHCTMYM